MRGNEVEPERDQAKTFRGSWGGVLEMGEVDVGK